MTIRNTNAMLVAAFTAASALALPAHAGDIDSFTISLEQPVSDGVPGPGAGNLETSTSMDVYTLNVAPGTVVFFDENGGSCNIRWSCEDANGDLLFDNDAICSSNPGTTELALGGDYTITVYSNNGTTGTYAFNVWEVNPVDEFAISVKSPVSDGVPGPGAGNIEEPGAIDRYTFNVAPGTVVFFDENGGNCNIHWNLYDSNGDSIFENNAICVTNPGDIELTLGGDYTIEVESGNTGVSGTYGFALYEVNAVEEFDISLEQDVSDGVPGPGAGNLEEAGAVDRYFFSVAPGTVVFFDENGGSCNIDWNLYDSNGDPIFENNAICVTNPGAIELTLGGEYTIDVESGNSGVTGTYAFILWEVEPVQEFALTLEQEVSDGIPGPGAGNIEKPGSIDRYTFNVAPGTMIFADENGGSCSIDWNLYDSNGDAVFENNAICTNNPGANELTLGGDYTIEVESGNSGVSGTYAFVIWLLNPVEEFVLTLDEIVADGVPGLGAGNLEEAGAVDRYFLDLPADSFVCFEEYNGSCNIDWNVYDPNGDPVFQNNAICTNDPGQYTLPLAGTYTIEVESGNSGIAGTYSFVVNTGKLADFDGNCHVDVNDLLELLAQWGTPNADLDGDNDTGIGDLLILLAEWG